MILETKPEMLANCCSTQYPQSSSQMISSACVCYFWNSRDCASVDCSQCVDLIYNKRALWHAPARLSCTSTIMFCQRVYLGAHLKVDGPSCMRKRLPCHPPVLNSFECGVIGTATMCHEPGTCDTNRILQTGDTLRSCMCLWFTMGRSRRPIR